mgnify:CR=1 FL=1
MASVSDILARKGDHVFTVTPDQTVLQAVSTMNEAQIGAVVVVDTEGRIVGMFTERDVLRRIVAERREPTQVRIADAMTREVLTVSPETEIEEAAELMKNRRIRHLPVVESSGRLLGLISIGDVNAWHTVRIEEKADFLEGYVFGRA